MVLAVSDSRDEHDQTIARPRVPRRAASNNRGAVQGGLAQIEPGTGTGLHAALVRGRASRACSPRSTWTLWPRPATEMNLRARPGPDVALVDVRMPPTYADEGLPSRPARFDRTTPALPSSSLSQHLEPEYALRLVEERPERAGYLLKERVGRVEQLLDAVAGSQRGSASSTGRRRRRPPGAAQAGRPARGAPPREREILALMPEGRSNQGICHALWGTVETHIRGAFSKQENKRKHRGGAARAGQFSPTYAIEAK